VDIGQKLVKLERDIAALQRSSRLTHASIENTAVQVYDGAGSLRGVIGVQADGTTAVTIVNGTAPPQPSDPVVTSILGGVNVAWDGTFTDGAPLPLDWQRVEVHASATAVYTPDATTLVGTIETAQGATVVVPTATPVYVRLMARNTSGAASTPSSTVGPYGPAPVVADDILDGIVTTVKLADDAVTAAKVAANAIDTAAIQDAAINAAKIGSAAVTAGALASAAVTSTAIANDAVTAGKVAADAITAREITAGAVTTAELAAGAVTATEIAANAITSGKIAANAVTATAIAAGSVQTAALAADAVAAGKIAADAVTAREIAASAVTASEIAANTIVAGNLAAGSVDATALSATAITGKTITGGTITGTTITGGTIQTATSGEHITLNEAGANKIIVYNSSSTAINELSARGLLVKGTTGAVLWLNPSATYPQLQLYNAASTSKATVQVTEPTTGDANLESFCGPFAGSSYSDMVWRTYLSRDFAVIERLRSTTPATIIGGRLYLDAAHSSLGFKNTDDSTQDCSVYIEPNYVHVDSARFQVNPPASASSALNVAAATGHTGYLLSAALDGVAKLTVDPSGNLATAGSLTVFGVGQRLPKRRTSNDTRTSTVTPTNDTQLTWSVDANAVYAIEGVLFVSGPGDFLMGWSYPTGCAGTWNGLGNGTTVVSGTGGGGTQQDISSSWGYTLRSETTDLPDNRTYGGISTTSFAIHVRGTLRVGSTAGTFALKWAQGTSNATATTLYIDSRLTLEKIG
jgi:hypothetical protein